ncbi:MAG TPA: glycosyltransferase [Lacunisphaera sp.]|nr:glycosyltransferase [Lacunisphaera sp.]
MSLRILLTADPIIPVPPVGYGGIERIVDALIRHYRAAGHVVALLAHPDSSAPVDAGFAWPDLRLDSVAATWRNGLALRRAAREFRADVVHSFSRLAYLLPLLPTRQPVVMSYQRHTGGRQLAVAARLGGRTLEFTGCSEFICGMGRPQGGRWTAVPNFVELEKLPFAPRVAADAPLVFLSRLDDIKGPDLAIAIARAARRRLILAGNPATSGPQLAFFEREVRPWIGRDGIEWVGEVGDEAKARLLSGAAALLVPIRWNEPFGIVFPEALACGTPVISCARGALPEIIEPGRTGFFITGVDDGVAAIGRLGELDRAACRRAVESRFSLQVCAPQYLELYRRIGR